MGMASETVWERGGIVVDSTHWPVLLETMPVVFPNDDATLDAWMAHVEALMASHASPFVMVVDASATKQTANAHARKRMADWLAGSAAYEKYCLATIYVVSSPLIRGALTAIHWLTGQMPARPVVGTIGEAWAESRRRLERAGLEMPPGVDGR